MKISVVGLGYVGLPLAEELKALGHDVIGTSRSQKNFAMEFLNPPANPTQKILDCDVLVLNIPPFENQLMWFLSWDTRKVKKIIFVSSTSVLKGHETLRQEEEWVRTFPDWLIVRPAGLIGRGRHPGKSLSGRKNLAGQNHPVNLIHVDDVIGFIIRAIDLNLSKMEINLVSDEHHSRKEFYSEFCVRAGIPVPEFDPSDSSEGPTVSGEAMKKIYQLKVPTMLGKSL